MRGLTQARLASAKAGVSKGEAEPPCLQARPRRPAVADRHIKCRSRANPRSGGGSFRMRIVFSKGISVDAAEISKLDSYLKRLFGSPRLRVVPRPQRDDYAEVFLGDEMFGRIVVDDEDDERSYNFEKAITLS